MPLTRTRLLRSHPAAGLIALSVAALLTGCSGADPAAVDGPTPAEATSSSSSTAAPHWDYDGEEGPDHWGELAANFATCGTGTAQSPLDLPAAAEPEDDDLALSYATVGEQSVDTGHTLQLDTEPGAGLQYNGIDYSLVQVHYHDPSEHTIGGQQAPIEFHFVHKDAEGNLLVIGVMGIAGEHDDTFQPFVDAATAGATPAPASVDIAAMMPSSLQHYAYVGSLTTPPCTENVQWLVMDTPVTLGQDQIDTLEDRYDHNNRPVQALNDREVHVAGQ